MGVIYKLLKHRHMNMDLSLKFKTDTMSRRHKNYKRILSIEGKILHEEQDVPAVTSPPAPSTAANGLSHINNGMDIDSSIPLAVVNSTNCTQIEQQDMQQQQWQQDQKEQQEQQQQQQNQIQQEQQMTAEHITQLCRFLAENAIKKRTQKINDSCTFAAKDSTNIQKTHINNEKDMQRTCQGSKRDILLKIRHQIFERKRQRHQLAHVQQGLVVWRPW